MVTKRISLTLAALAGIGLAIGQGAGAQVIVQTFSIASLTPPSSFTANTFNTALGVLGAVELTVDTNITASVDIFNNNASPEPFTNATASIPESVTAPGVPTINDTVVAGPISGTANAGPSVTDFTGIPGTNTTSVFVPGSQFSLYENPPSGLTLNIGASVGSGTFSGTETNGTGDLFFGGNIAGSGTVTLTYFYQPAGTIPEPGATTFLAAGVLGSLGMVFRRRRKA